MFQPFASINPLCLQCNIYMRKKSEKRNSDGKIKSIVFECPRCGNVEYYLPHRKFEEM